MLTTSVAGIFMMAHSISAVFYRDIVSLSRSELDLDSPQTNQGINMKSDFRQVSQALITGYFHVSDVGILSTQQGGRTRAWPPQVNFTYFGNLVNFLRFFDIY